MNIKRLLAPAILAAAALAGCATPRPTPPDPILCLDKAQCDAMWSRAQAFVAQRAAYKIKIVSESIIQTEGPLPYSTKLALVVTRETNRDGSGTIQLNGYCDNIYGCSPKLSDLGDSFVIHVARAR